MRTKDCICYAHTAANNKWLHDLKAYTRETRLNVNNLKHCRKMSVFTPCSLLQMNPGK